MNIPILINYFIFIIVLVSIIKNLFCFIFMKEKFYFYFMLFLIIFLSVLIIKRIIPFYNIDLFNKINKTSTLIYLPLMSCAAFYLAKYFLSIETINPLTISYLLLELVLSFAFFLLRNSHLDLFFIIINIIVMGSSILLQWIIGFKYFKTQKDLGLRLKIRFLLFTYINISLFILLYYNILNQNSPFFFCFTIFLMIGYMEIDIILKAVSFPEFNLISVKEEFSDETDNIIFKMLLAGKLYREISESTGISINTVKKRISGIYKKYGVSTRAELLNKFILK